MSAPIPVRTLLGPARYAQARGAITRLGEFAAPIGNNPLVVAGDVVCGLAVERPREGRRRPASGLPSAPG